MSHTNATAYEVLRGLVRMCGIEGVMQSLVEITAEQTQERDNYEKLRDRAAINRALEYMDEWDGEIVGEFTPALLHNIFPSFSADECEKILQTHKERKK